MVSVKNWPHALNFMNDIGEHLDTWINWCSRIIHLRTWIEMCSSYIKQLIPRLISKMEICLKNQSTRKGRDNYHKHKTLNNFACGIWITVGAPGQTYLSFTDTQPMSYNSNSDATCKIIQSLMLMIIISAFSGTLILKADLHFTNEPRY
jgi:hypothetical protein